VLAALAAALLIAAPGASAHATLVSSQPLDGATLDTAPAQLVLRFSEGVESSLTSVRVYGPDGQELDVPDPTRPAANTLVVSMPPSLDRGTYTVSWQVVSADSHPVQGAFVFSVGAPSVALGGVPPTIGADEPPRYVDVAFTAVRFGAFVLLLLGAGSVLALAYVLRDAPAVLVARLGRLLVPIGLGLAVFSLAGIGLQGASATGSGLGAAVDPDVLRGVLDSDFGRFWLARAGLAVALALAGWWLVRAADGDRFAPLLAAGSAAAYLVMSPAATSHARAAGALAVASDIAHVAAAAAWTGGLACTVLALRWSGEARWELAARVVPRFSALALGSVAVLVAAGAVNGYLQVDELAGLWDTTYGRLLVLKVLLVLPVLALGAYNQRRLVPRLRAAGASLVERRRFLRTTGAELGLMVAVVAVTAVLVAEPPASARPAGGPFTTTLVTARYHMTATVTPARVGQNRIELDASNHAGRPAHIDEVRVLASLPGEDIGPLDLKVQRRPGGRYVIPGAQLPLAGNWQLRVELRQGEFDLTTRKFTVPITEAS
jgi:copper transport protein